MKIIYENKVIPVNSKKQTGIADQIVMMKKSNEIWFRIYFSNNICHGSIKPVVSVTNQIIKQISDLSPVIKEIKDNFTYELNYIRTIKVSIN